VSLARRSFLKSAGCALAAAAHPQWVRGVERPGVVYLHPADDAYAAHSNGFNQRIVKRPAVLAMCSSEAGVCDAVREAQRLDLPLAIRSGGHSFEGFSSSDGGMVINLSKMRALRLSANDFLIAEPGAVLSDLFDTLLPRGRIIPVGSCGGVGLAGLTLGGGYGMFSREWGLTCDSLVGLRMVTADGRVVDSIEDPDLLWACRGGGNGNFGVVTQLRYQTYAAPQRLPRHRIKFRGLNAARAVELCERWFAISPGLPHDAFSAWVLNGSTLTVLITWFRPGSKNAVQAVAERLGQGADTVAAPANEALPRAVRRYYGMQGPVPFKNASAGLFDDFSDLAEGLESVFETVIEGPGVIFQVNTLGGAIAERSKLSSSAFPHRMAPFLGEVQSCWEREEVGVRAMRAVDVVLDKLAAMGVTRHYRNYPSLRYARPLASYYGASNLERLCGIKRRLDPHDRFRHPQSIPHKKG